MSQYSDFNLAGLIGNRALSKPDFPVLTVENGGKSQLEMRTYAQLWRNGHRLAWGLTRLGLKPGDSFALLMANHAEFVDAMLAAAITGTVFVPIDPRAKGEKLAFFLNNARCKGVISADYALSNLLAVREQLQSGTWIVALPSNEGSGNLAGEQGFIDYAEAFVSEAQEHPLVELGADAPMQLIFTSGTTGDPKGIVMTHSELIELAYADRRNEEAQVLRRDAIRLSRRHDCLALEGLLLLQQVRLMTSSGELERAQRLLRRLENELGGACRDEARQLAAHICLHRAEVLNAKGDRCEATASFNAGIRLCLESGDPAAILGFISLAELDALDGEFARAFSRLEEAERLMQRQQVDELVYQGRLTLVRGNLWLRQGKFDRARNLAKDWLHDSTMERAVQSELVIRFELLQSRAGQGMGEEVVDGLEQLLARVLRHGWRTVACEIQVALAEAHHGEGRRRKAQSTLLDGLALARQLGMTRIERFMSQGDSSLAGWVIIAGSGFEDSGAVTDVVQLSRRELAVLQLIAGGLANQEIADQLHISLHTVKSHAHRINVKLGVSRRTQAILRARELRLVS